MKFNDLLAEKSLPAFRLVYVVFIATASGQTLAGALHHAPELPSWFGARPLAVLVASEVVAAILFLFRRAEIVTCGALIAIFAVAEFLSLEVGDWSLRFLYYGATAIFITAASRSETRDASVDASRRPAG